MTDQSTERDVVDVLTSDHQEVTELLAQIWQTQDAEQRRDLTDVMISELVRHSVAEEMFVYPAMKKHLPDGEAAVEHDVEEHKEIERLMKSLEDLGVIGGEDVHDVLWLVRGGHGTELPPPGAAMPGAGTPARADREVVGGAGIRGRSGPGHRRAGAAG